MRKFTKSLCAAAAALPLMLAAVHASAQSIDYGSLETLFNEPVTTSATGSPQRSTEVPVDMTIISAGDIKRSGASDLPTILSRVAGVDILNFGSNDSDIGIRGYDQARSPRLLVLINGRQVYLDHFGYTDWASLPVELSEIRQIEVVRGPNSAIFGFNAVSGVVNIITYNPKYDNINAAEVRMGTQGGSAASLVQTFHVGDSLSLRGSLGYDKQNEWDNVDSSTVTSALYANPYNYRGNIDLVAQLTPKSDLRIEGSMYNGVSTQSISTFAYAIHAVKTDSYKATYTNDSKWGRIQVQAYHNDLNATVPGRTYLNSISVASVEDLFKIGNKNTIRLGLEYRDNRLDTASYAGGRVSYTVFAPSVMWNLQATDKLSLTAAARIDKLSLQRSGTFPTGTPQNNNALWDRDIQETSVNIGAVYKITAADTLRATYARGVQAPTLLELGGLLIPPATTAPTGVLITGNPNLEPAIVTNYELAYDRELTTLNARFSVKLFSQKTENVKGQFSTSIIDIPATATTWTTFYYANISDSKMNGVEVSASGKIASAFHWSADTSYTNIEDSAYTTEAQLILRKVDFEATSPKVRGNVALGWSNDKWAVDASAHYVGKFSSYNGNALEPVPAYTTIGARIARRLSNGIEIALNGQNLAEPRQFQAKGISGLKAERRLQLVISKSW